MPEGGKSGKGNRWAADEKPVTASQDWPGRPAEAMHSTCSNPVCRREMAARTKSGQAGDGGPTRPQEKEGREVAAGEPKRPGEDTQATARRERKEGRGGGSDAGSTGSTRKGRHPRRGKLAAGKERHGREKEIYRITNSVNESNDMSGSVNWDQMIFTHTTT